MNWWLFLQLIVLILLVWGAINNIIRRRYLYESIYRGMPLKKLAQADGTIYKATDDAPTA